MSKKEKDEATRKLLEGVAQKNGWQRLNWQDVDIDVKLTEKERAEFQKSQTNGIIEIEEMQAELADVRAEYKNKIDAIDMTVSQAAHALKKGSRVVTKNMPTFLDSKRGIKMFYDTETAEIVKEVEATDRDRQCVIDPAA